MIAHEDYIKRREWACPSCLLDPCVNHPLSNGCSTCKNIDALVLDVIGENQYSLRSLDRMIPSGSEFMQNILRDKQRLIIKGEL